ncbi:chorismate synthase [Vagococcus coleopterorum]|uniref:Chorismate synthase n=1 Tax=Vagococcus coleopterorum TaxID=2714946 RepID=A0A6G8ANB0_9ENTE|nr:chorismate synthase [Vagococcus coleopterorum]QIL46558.1 chorismate synthase [Vagococcus coleopterorum]
MRYLTAGESHGPQLTAIIDGLPAGLPLNESDINNELAKRQVGYGRGGRMKIESDKVQITSGLRHGKTLGSPLTLIIQNKDWENWQSVMGTAPVTEKEKLKRQVTKPRPGHADLVGGMKYGHRDLRNVLERSSARETAMRVAIGAVAKKLLSELDITTMGFVKSIGGISIDSYEMNEESVSTIESSDLRCPDESQAVKMRTAIDQAKQDGDTLGGVISVQVNNLPVGLGSYVQWDQKLDAKLAFAIQSINAIKGVEFGDGFELAAHPGSEGMDPIEWNNGYSRTTNHLGGFEGGMTTGQPVIVNAVMKPIPTLYKPLQSVDIETKEAYQASIERSDACAVPAASVIAENVTATVFAEAILDKFDADQFDQLKAQIKDYRQACQNF